MKKLLIIALLVWGCDDKTYNNICQVETKRGCVCPNSGVVTSSENDCFEEVSRDACMLMNSRHDYENGDCSCWQEVVSQFNEGDYVCGF